MRCPADDQPLTLAHVGFEVVAMTLAEPLRREFSRHLAAHGCAERTGFAYCDEAMTLFVLLPAGDRVIT